MTLDLRAAVVVVNWNTKPLLLRAVTCLAGAYPLAVIDNASTDGSIEALRARHPEALTIANTENRGFAAAVNQGIAAVTAPYVLVANADVECPPDTVARLAGFLDAHPRAAVAGPRLRNPDASLQLSWGREPSLLAEAFQRWWWRTLERHGQDMLQRWAPVARRTDWVLGACFMVRREAWQSLRGLDERYGMYFEEVDLCSRARRAGWEVWYDPAGEAIHHGRASTSQIPEAMALAYRRSQLRYYRRFHGAQAERLLLGYLWTKFGWTVRGRRLLRNLNAAGP